MGITTPLSTNAAMTIGGLTVGVTPLDMAHAYETIAHGGRRISGTLGEPGEPVGIQEVDAGSGTLPDGSHSDINRVTSRQVLPPSVAATETSILETVVESGTGRAAAIGQFAAGKTGTTTNYGDAWFVGWNHRYTVAVWVGYPNSLVPMTTDFNGKPVFGGTFPALIWHDFMTAAIHLEGERTERSQRRNGSGANGSSSSSEGAPPAPASTAGSAAPGRSPSAGGGSTKAPPASAAPGTENGTSGGGGSEHAAKAPPEGAESPSGTPPSSSPPASSPPPQTAPPPTGGVSPGG
jgi:penicillin-binding protein 1A